MMQQRRTVTLSISSLDGPTPAGGAACDLNRNGSYG